MSSPAPPSFPADSWPPASAIRGGAPPYGAVSEPCLPSRMGCRPRHACAITVRRVDPWRSLCTRSWVGIRSFSSRTWLTTPAARLPVAEPERSPWLSPVDQLLGSSVITFQARDFDLLGTGAAPMAAAYW